MVRPIEEPTDEKRETLPLHPKWTKRMLVMEETKAMPLIYDRTRTGTLACAKELGNVAIAAIPKRASRSQEEYDAEMDEFLVSIKASSRP